MTELHPPKGLSLAERNIFRTVCRWIGDRLEPEDTHCVEQYARALCRYRHVSQLLAESETLDSALVYMINCCRGEVEKNSQRLGLSPLDRRKLTGGPAAIRPPATPYQPPHILGV